MAKVILDVAKVAQQKNMSCWYAAACMVSYYFRAGPHLGLPKVWTDNLGISPADLKKLAEVQGLQFLNSSTHEFTAASLMATITQYGPIRAAGYWFGAAHAIVVSGAEDTGGGTVFFNDPDGGTAKTGTIDWFNEKRMRGTMMVKDKSRS